MTYVPDLSDYAREGVTALERIADALEGYSVDDDGFRTNEEGSNLTQIKRAVDFLTEYIVNGDWK